MKQKQFILTIDYQGEYDLRGADIECLIIDGKYVKGNEEFLKNIRSISAKEIDSQEGITK